MWTVKIDVNQDTENMKGIEMSRAILEARIKWKKMSSKLWEETGNDTFLAFIILSY